MNTAAFVLARNDADLIEAFVRHHAPLFDLLVVVDQGSLDGTRDILEALRQDDLPLMIVDAPVLGADESAQLTRLYRMVAPVFNPELVYLLQADQFIRTTDRATLEAELGRLPAGTGAVLRRQNHAPDLASAARTGLADPLAALPERQAADAPGEFVAVLRRNPADDATLVLGGYGLPIVRGAEALPTYLADSATLACFPVRNATQLRAKLLHAWQVHRARHGAHSGARTHFAWRTWLDPLLAGQAISAEAVVQAARGDADPATALVHDPLPSPHAALQHLSLARHDAVGRVVSGVGWPAETPPLHSLATGTAMDLAPLRDLAAGLQAQRAVVMGSPAWARAFGHACPAVALHVPQDDQPDPVIDLLLMPEMQADFVQEIAGAADPQAIRRIACWPAQPHAAGALAAELAHWAGCGWEPDLMRTLVFRALSSYRLGRQGALVLGPADTARPERAQAVRTALLAMSAADPAWVDPAASLLWHPLQTVGLQTPAPVAKATAPAPQVAAPPRPRSVLILGAGRSGTSCLAGMFGTATHHHARDLYKPQVSNPKGFFEAGHINDLNEAMLLMSSVAHLGAEGTRTLLQGFEPHQLWLARFPDAMPAQWNDDHRRQIAQAVADTPFCLKDPRMSVTAPAWLAQAPDALVLSIHRPPAVTAESVLRECRVATYLLDFRISACDAFAVWRQAYRRAVKLYRGGADVLFLRYDDLFDNARLAQLETHVRAPLQRDFAEAHLNRTEPHVKVDAECQALHQLLDALALLSFAGERAKACSLIDQHLARWPDRDHRMQAAPQSPVALAHA